MGSFASGLMPTTIGHHPMSSEKCMSCVEKHWLLYSTVIFKLEIKPLWHKHMQLLWFSFTTGSVAKSRQPRSALKLCSLWLVRLRSGWVSLPDGCNILADTKAISDRPSLGPSGCALTECPTPTGCLQWQNINKASPAALQHVNYQAGRQTHIYRHITNTQTDAVIQLLLYDVSAGGSELVAIIWILRSYDVMPRSQGDTHRFWFPPAISQHVS